LRVLLIRAGPQQILDDLSAMLLARCAGEEGEQQRALLARKVDIPATGMPQAKPSEQRDLESCHS
jgi:hypothetical protein